MSIDTPSRIVVLIGILVAAAAAAFALLLLGHSRAATKAPQTPAVATHHAKTTPQPTSRPPAKPKPAAPILLEGLPVPIARALAHHPVVVVALYEHRTGDAVAVAEARAGAAQARTPFIALDVLRERDAGSIAGLTGSLADPGIVIVRRPGKIVRRLDGHQDRQVVAQAAHDAR
jgi:hypothetical protein